MIKTLLITAVVFVSGLAFAGELEDVKAWAQTYAECDTDHWMAEELPTKNVIVYDQESYDGVIEPVEYVFYDVPCYAGAYNFTSVFVVSDEYSKGGYRMLSFPYTVVDYEMVKVYSEELEQEVDAVKSWKLVGIAAGDGYLINADFDANKRTISTFAKGRGIGDAFSSNVYKFTQGHWVLIKSIEDPTYDGDHTPITVFSAD